MRYYLNEKIIKTQNRIRVLIDSISCIHILRDIQQCTQIHRQNFIMKIYLFHYYFKSFFFQHIDWVFRSFSIMKCSIVLYYLILFLHFHIYTIRIGSFHNRWNASFPLAFSPLCQLFSY